MQQSASPKPIAVVTGASTGFGRLTAKALAAAGYHVFAGIRGIADRNAGTVRDLAALGIDAVELDVTSEASVDAAARTVLAKSGNRIDVLVNNAGSGYFGLVEAFTPQLVHEQYDVNVYGPLRVNRAFLPSMRERRTGLIVYVSSVVGRFTTPYIGIYASTKYALEALAETSAYELKAFGIDVAIVQPGAYQTNIGNRAVMADDSARTAAYGDVADALSAVVTGLTAAASDKPHEVADAIVAIAQRPAGSRPLRTVVPENPVTAAINAAAAPAASQALDAYGLGAYAPAVPLAEPAAV